MITEESKLAIDVDIPLDWLENIVLSSRETGRSNWRFKYMPGDYLEVESYVDHLNVIRIHFKRKNWDEILR